MLVLKTNGCLILKGDGQSAIHQRSSTRIGSYCTDRADFEASKSLSPNDKSYLMNQLLGLTSISGFGAQLRELCSDARVTRHMDIGGHFG